jgi:hypothetical protein
LLNVGAAEPAERNRSFGKRMLPTVLVICRRAYAERSDIYGKSKSASRHFDPFPRRGFGVQQIGTRVTVVK